VPNKHQIDKKENQRVYEATQIQRGMERKIRSLKKRMIVAKASGDMEQAKAYRKALTEKQKQIEKFCKDNNLRRQTEREMVQEEY
jgi:phosphoribosylpyrophosphate synthetase